VTRKVARFSLQDVSTEVVAVSPVGGVGDPEVDLCGRWAPLGVGDAKVAVGRRTCASGEAGARQDRSVQLARS